MGPVLSGPKMLLVEWIGMELDDQMVDEYNPSSHSEAEDVDDLDFELCFTDHDDADAWSGVSLNKWCDHDYDDDVVPIDDDWDHVENTSEFDYENISAEQTIHVCREDEAHAPKTPVSVADPKPSDFEVIQHATLADLLVDIIFYGIRYLILCRIYANHGRFQMEALRIVAQEIQFLSTL